MDTRSVNDDYFSMVGNALMAFGGWVLMYTGLPSEPAAVLAVLMMIDFVSGCTKACVSGENLSSRRMKVGVASKLMLLLIPLSGALAAKGMGQDMAWLIVWVVNVMILAELYSIVANVYTIRTGENLPEWEVTSIIGKKIQRMMSSMIEKD